MTSSPKPRKSSGKNKEKPRRSGVFWVLIQRGKKLFDLFLRQGGEQFPRRFSQAFHFIIRIHYVFLLNKYPKGIKTTSEISRKDILTRFYKEVKLNKTFLSPGWVINLPFFASGCLGAYSGPPARSPGGAGADGSRQLSGGISHGHPSFRQKTYYGHTQTVNRPLLTGKGPLFICIWSASGRIWL